MDKKRDPFRRSTLGLPPNKPRVQESINPEFEDISDPLSMAAFIDKNRDKLTRQDEEIDNLELSHDEEHEPAPQSHEPLKAQRFKPQESPQLKPFQRRFDTQQEQNEPEQEVEEIALERPSSPKPQNPEEDDLPFKIADNVPPEIRARMIAAHRAERNNGSPGKVISNAPTGNVPRKGPVLTETQLRKKIEEEFREKIDRGEWEGIKPPKTEARFAVRSTSNAQKYQRFEPVSGCIFYEETEIFVRKFNLVDAVNVTEAQENRDISAYIDAIGATLKEPFNVRDLTYPDFRHLLYWHWLNSYTKSPHDLQWTSKYGNRNLYTVKLSNLKLLTPVIDRDTYFNDWYAQGYAVPTMRDAEIFFKEDLSPKEQRVLNKAQFFAGDPSDSIQDKIDRMVRLTEEHGLELIEGIADFEKAIRHGIKEFVDVVDDQFKPVVWLETLKKRHGEALKQAERYKDEDTEDERLVREEELDGLAEDIEDLSGRLERKEVVQADVESISINRPVLNFFPVL